MEKVDKKFIEEIKRKVEKELREKEISVIEYWKSEIEKIYNKRSTTLASLQIELKSLCEKMENRVKLLKKECQGL